LKLTPDQIKEFEKNLVEVCEMGKIHIEELSDDTTVVITEKPDPYEEE